MKKMFFTAVALVAFCFTSMANTIEVKEVVIPVEEKEEVVVKKTPCDYVWIAYYTIYINTGNGDHIAGSQEAWNYADTNAAAQGC